MDLYRRQPADEIREVWQDFCYFAAICSALVTIIAGSSHWLASTALPRSAPLATVWNG